MSKTNISKSIENLRQIISRQGKVWLDFGTPGMLSESDYLKDRHNRDIIDNKVRTAINKLGCKLHRKKGLLHNYGDFIA